MNSVQFNNHHHHHHPD
ncbi:his operon leader peptide [Klebsiella indica]|uniref:his operon leader peptide n=1 Tax=Klebsiella indica TaxID=2582917 RepID=A0A5R9LFK6_9ENTR|nr:MULTISPECIES: his operon leader peptide [Klebsiella]TLV14359.1 his operon leader peptide [Klebsiella indica]